MSVSSPATGLVASFGSVMIKLEFSRSIGMKEANVAAFRLRSLPAGEVKAANEEVVGKAKSQDWKSYKILDTAILFRILKKILKWLSCW